jgi:hypothetical protein
VRAVVRAGCIRGKASISLHKPHCVVEVYDVVRTVPDEKGKCKGNSIIDKQVPNLPANRYIPKASVQVEKSHSSAKNDYFVVANL